MGDNHGKNEVLDGVDNGYCLTMIDDDWAMVNNGRW